MKFEKYRLETGVKEKDKIDRGKIAELGGMNNKVHPRKQASARQATVISVHLSAHRLQIILEVEKKVLVSHYWKQGGMPSPRSTSQQDIRKNGG